MIFKCDSLRKPKTASLGKHLVTLHRMMSIARSPVLTVHVQSCKMLTAFLFFCRINNTLVCIQLHLSSDVLSMFARLLYYSASR